MSARLSWCSLGSCLKNYISGPELKDCISPEGQLLADFGAKETLFEVSSCVSLNRYSSSGWEAASKSHWGFVCSLIGQDPDICSAQEHLENQRTHRVLWTANDSSFHIKGKWVSFTEADRRRQDIQGLIPARINEDVAPSQPSSAPHPLSDLIPVGSVRPKFCPRAPRPHAPNIGY